MPKHAAVCTDPKHHVHGADDYVHEVEQACTKRGLRLTPLRADVLPYVTDQDKLRRVVVHT